MGRGARAGRRRQRLCNQAFPDDGAAQPHPSAAAHELYRHAEHVQRGGIQVDREHMQVRKDGVLLSLTLTEYRILLTLVQHQGIVSRGALLEALWDVDSRFIDDNTLSVHISRLREKIGAQHIRTMRGVGYQWMD